MMTTTANSARVPSPRRRRRQGLGIFYSHANARELEEVRLHLEVSNRISPITFWDDTQLVPGEVWRDRVERELASVRGALLLISQHFLRSEFVMTVEVPAIVAAAAKGDLLVWCLYIRPSSVKDFPQLTQFAGINSPDRPLWKLRPNDRTEVLIRCSDTIRHSLAH